MQVINMRAPLWLSWFPFLSLIVVSLQLELFDNPGFESTLDGNWHCNVCSGSRSTDAHTGAFSFLAAERTNTWQGPLQDVTNVIIGGRHYAISGYAKILPNNLGAQGIRATLKYTMPDESSQYEGVAVRNDISVADGWVKFDSDFQALDLGQIETLIYFEGPASGVDFQIDSLSLTEIDTSGSWRTAARRRINSSLRKGLLNIEVTGNRRNEQFNVDIQQVKHEFGFGTAVDSQKLQDHANYWNWYKDNFDWAVLENDFKWRQTEWNEGVFTWTKADIAMTMLEGADKKVRGHTIHWANKDRNPQWVQNIVNPTTLHEAAMKRIRDLLGRYAGRLEHWDVNNEMLTNSFFLDSSYNYPQIRYNMFQLARQQDPNAKLFLNDYSVVSYGLRTIDYVAQAAEFLAAGAPVDGMGVQGHLSGNPQGPVLLHRLNRLSAAGLPIWVTELDYANPDASIRASVLEDALLAFFSHPSVEGVLFWGFWDQQHWRGVDASLVEGPNLVENAAGLMWKRLFHTDWRSNYNFDWVIRRNRGVTVRAFYGQYNVTVRRKNGNTLVGVWQIDLPKSTGSTTLMINL